MDPDDARRRFVAARVARLATVRRSGSPHLVPVTFACSGDTIYTAVDAKPKTTRRLARLANIAVNPRVSLLVDHYGEDWQELWWARADGHARVADAGQELADAVDALAGKYPQYQRARPEGPAIVVRVDAWAGWAAGGTSAGE